MAWDKMCKAKSEGVLEFRDIGNFDQVLLAKKAWMLLHEPQSLLARFTKLDIMLVTKLDIMLRKILWMLLRGQDHA